MVVDRSWRMCYNGTVVCCSLTTNGRVAVAGYPAGGGVARQDRELCAEAVREAGAGGGARTPLRPLSGDQDRARPRETLAAPLHPQSRVGLPHRQLAQQAGQHQGQCLTSCTH